MDELELESFVSFVSACVEGADKWSHAPRIDTVPEDLMKSIQDDLDLLEHVRDEFKDDEDEAWRGPKKQNLLLHPSVEVYQLVTCEGLPQIFRYTGALFRTNPDDSVEFEVVLGRPKKFDDASKLRNLFDISKTIRFDGDRAQEFFSDWRKFGVDFDST